MPSISFPLAFLAGLLSFISPCVLPLAPIYLGYLSGNSLSGDVPSNRRQVFSHALFFVAGFTLVFVILFGLHTMGIVTIPLLTVTRRVEVGRGIGPGYLRSVLFGVTFAAGWTPCIGPLLGTVMTLAFTEPSRAMGFLFIYALGLAVPFLVTAALLTQAVGCLKRLNRHMRAVEVASGLLMVGVGVLLISGTFSILNSYFIRITPEWLLQYM
jgi:cytochrome c-type biogenesis protein